MLTGGLLVAVGIFYAAAPQQKHSSREELFGAALHQEQVEGNLEVALNTYKKIVASYGVDRGLAAKAEFRIGICYEKLGRAEARKVYERVLREYADQNEVVAQARTRLAALGRLEAADRPSVMMTRRIWQLRPNDDLLGTPSADGHYLSYTDWETADLAVRDLVTSKNRRVTNLGSWESGDFAESSAMSRDGKQIAYAWWIEKESRYDLRVVSLDGLKPRVLYTREGLWLRPLDWSPDGKQILAHFSQKEGPQQMALVSANDGSVRVLRIWPWGHAPEKMVFSPDGHYIAYDLPIEKDPRKRDIYLLSIDDSRETALVEHAANDILFGWAPDGDRILFGSDRTGSWGAWVLRVARGVPQGAPELIKRDLGPTVPLGFTANGAFYYGVQSGMVDVHTATMDPATGKPLERPTAVAERFVGANLAPIWSPDGKYLAYLSERGRRHLSFVPKTLVIRSVTSGEERELRPELRELAWPPNSLPRWSPDGRWILVAGIDLNGIQGLYRVDAQSGAVAPVVQSNETRLNTSKPDWFPDGKTIVYVKQRWEGPRFLVIHDLETGLEKELYRGESYFGQIALSPNGKQLAFYQENKFIMLMDVNGGKPQEVLQLKKEEAGFDPNPFLEWTPDGRYLLFSKRNSELWRIAATGGAPQRLELTIENLRHLRIHPDGQRIAFTAGRRTSELWVMENFLPPLKAGR